MWTQTSAASNSIHQAPGHPADLNFTKAPRRARSNEQIHANHACSPTFSLNEAHALPSAQMQFGRVVRIDATTRAQPIDPVLAYRFRLTFAWCDFYSSEARSHVSVGSRVDIVLPCIACRVVGTLVLREGLLPGPILLNLGKRAKVTWMLLNVVTCHGARLL